MSQSTIFQPCPDGAHANWVLNSTVGTGKLMCFAQGPGPLNSESDALPTGHRAILGSLVMNLNERRFLH